jgi:CheY-like chemotaxis protein
VTGEIVGIDEIENRHECDVSDIWSQFLCIKITDNGCGMEPEMLEHIFNPFFTTKIGGKGTGLGLSVVEQIIHSHNGYIFAESKVDAGSTFYIYFPMAAKADISSAVSDHEEDVNMRILAVDDNGKVLKLLERDFKKLNIEITAVSNTEEAKVLLEKEKFDVMLVDQELSRTSQTDNGLIFAIAAGSLYPDLIKIIMTGQVKKELIEAKQHGLIESYIEKPVSDTRILEEIHKIIG